MIDRRMVLAAILCASSLWTPLAWGQAALREGDTVVVTTNDAKAMAGTKPLGTIPRGTRFRVEKVNDQWIRGTFTVNGQQVSGWMKVSDVSRQAATPSASSPAATPPAQPKPAAPARSSPAASTPRNDVANFQKGMETYRRLLPRYDKKYDQPGLLFGTTPIRQGMTATITPQMQAASYADFNNYYYYAYMALDPATTRTAETERLLTSLGAVPAPEEILSRIEARVAELADRAAAPDREDAVYAMRRKIAELRSAGKYTTAVATAAELKAANQKLFGDAAWQTRDAQSLIDTLQRMAKLPADAQRQLAVADAATHEYQTMVLSMQFHRAKDIARQQYAARQQQLGAQHADTESALAWLSFLERLHSAEGEEARHHQLLAACQSRLPAGHPLIARSLSNLGAVRQDRGDFDAALKFTTRALQQRLDALAKVERFEADVVLLLLRMERILEEQARLKETRRCAAVARAITRTLPAAARTAIVKGLFEDTASLELAETGEGPFYLSGGLSFRPSFSIIALRGGSPYLIADQFGGSQSSFNSLSMAREVASPSGADAKFPDIPWMTAATVYQQQGDNAAAERFARQAVKVAQPAYANRPEFQWRTAAALHKLGQVLDMTGNTAEAIEAYDEAVRLQRRVTDTELEKVRREKAAGKDQTYEPLSQTGIFAELLMEVANVYRRAGKPVEAERVAREAVKFADIPVALVPTAMNRKLSKSVMTRATLAKVLLEAGKRDEAETQFRYVLKEEFNNWAFSMWGGMSTPDTLSGLIDLDAGRNGGKLSAEAASMAATAWAMTARSRVTGQSISVFRQWDQYARVLASTDRAAAAIRLREMAIESAESVRRSVSGDEISRARFFSELNRYDHYSAIVRLEVGMKPDATDSYGDRPHGAAAAFDFLERGRGRALLDLLARGDFDVDRTLADLQTRRNDPQLAARIAALRQQAGAATNSVAKLTVELQEARKNPQKLQSLGAKAAGHLQQLQNQLQQAQETERRSGQDLLDIARSARNERVPEPMSAAQVAAALKEGELLLAYDVSADDAVLLVVHPGGQVEGFPLLGPDGQTLSGKVLNASLAEYFAEISREETAPPATDRGIEVVFGDALRKALLPDAVLEQMRKSSRVFVVADGPLHRVPLEALANDEKAESLLLDELPPLVYGPSATVLLSRPLTGDVADASAKDKSRPQLVALGDPAFDGAGAPKGAATQPGSDAKAAAAFQKRTASLQSFGALAPLPGTRVEIEAIVSEVRKLNGPEESVRVLTGADATQSNLYQATQSPRLLHLATHGLAEGGRRAWESSLAMAAPPQIKAGDTGFLSLADLLDQWGGRLQGTDLVVLSACRTARGELESGDGFVALTWGFLYAGSENVVASLWEVDDMATALLMARLYQNLLGTFDKPRELEQRTYEPGQSIPPADALREAKRWLRTIPRDEAKSTADALLGKEATLPSGDRPFADPFYWGAFILLGHR